MKLSNGMLLWKVLADEDECRWRISSKTITQDEWLAMIDKIPSGAIRIQVACIVWWDYVNKPWQKFERYLEAWKSSQRADKEQVRQALMDLGYPERLATERIKALTALVRAA